MTAIRVVRQGKKGKTDLAPLYVEFYINREKIRIAVRLSVTSKEWDEQNEVIKGRDKESKDKNLIISNIRSRVSDIFVRARLKNETLTKESFFRQYNNPSDFGSSLILHGFTSNKLAKLFLSVIWKHHVSIIKKLETFAPGLVFSEITHEFLLSFFAYLRKIGNMDSTAWRNMATIKIYVVCRHTRRLYGPVTRSRP
ncbi:MAG: phage integrase SAM-like domain-containing protein [Bacteroides thetaiotaomicron]